MSFSKSPVCAQAIPMAALACQSPLGLKFSNNKHSKLAAANIQSGGNPIRLISSYIDRFSQMVYFFYWGNSISYDLKQRCPIGSPH